MRSPRRTSESETHAIERPLSSRIMCTPYACVRARWEATHASSQAPGACAGMDESAQVSAYSQEESGPMNRRPSAVWSGLRPCHTSCRRMHLRSPHRTNARDTYALESPPSTRVIVQPWGSAMFLGGFDCRSGGGLEGRWGGGVGGGPGYGPQRGLGGSAGV